MPRARMIGTRPITMTEAEITSGVSIEALGVYAHICLWLERREDVTLERIAELLGDQERAQRLFDELQHRELLVTNDGPTEPEMTAAWFESLPAPKSQQRPAEGERAPRAPTPRETPPPGEPPERHRPDEDGQWSGPWPLASATRYPACGQNIVYLLRAANDLVIYVGSTNHFTARMKAHQGAGKHWASWTAQACETREEAYDVESEFLQTYMPHLNVAGPGTITRSAGSES